MIKMATSSLATRAPLTLLSLLVIFYNHHIDLVEGCLVLSGGEALPFRDYQTPIRSGFRDKSHVVSRDLEFSCYGNVTGWAAYSERAGTFTTITFQVWRAREEAATTGCSRTYDLVGSHTFSNVETDSTKLLNVTRKQNPIPVQPGDVVGFYADFDGSQAVSIQNNDSFNYLSYVKRNVDSANLLSAQQISNCSYFTESLSGTPIISAMVDMQEIVTTQPPQTTDNPMTYVQTSSSISTTAETTTSTFVSTPTTVVTVSPLTTSNIELTQATSQPTTTSGDSQTTATLFPLTSASEDTTSTTEVGYEVTSNASASGDDSNNTKTVAITQQSTDEANPEQNQKMTIPTVLISSIVAVVVAGIVVVVVCLVVGKCVGKKFQRQRNNRRSHLQSLSFKKRDDLDGSRERSDSHIYCEMSEIFPTGRKDFVESYSDLDHAAVFKELDCSCKIPSRYKSMAMADYEVPISTFKRSGLATSQERKNDFENTYETPLDAKRRMQERALATDEDKKAEDHSHYDTPKPVEDEYTFMASVPRERNIIVQQLARNADNIYENVSDDYI